MADRCNTACPTSNRRSKDLQLPDFINHLIPIVEAQFSTPVTNNFGNSFVTTGTINPGAIWVGSYFQVGLEATILVREMCRVLKSGGRARSGRQS